MNIQEFKTNHKDFFDRLLSDTWLCEEPIPVEETIAVWNWCIMIDEESVLEKDFEKTFEISFKEITDWWNKNILEVT